MALEAGKGVRTLSELRAAYAVHPTGIAHWKRRLIEGAPGVFERGASPGGKTEDEVTAPLYQEIGRLKMEVDWLKRKL